MHWNTFFSLKKKLRDQRRYQILPRKGDYLLISISKYLFFLYSVCVWYMELSIWFRFFGRKMIGVVNVISLIFNNTLNQVKTLILIQSHVIRTNE